MRDSPAEPPPSPPGAPLDLGRYLDACATAPPSAAVLAAMADAGTHAWANPSSLHGPGLAAAECLERSRWRLAEDLGCAPEQIVFGSGGSEAIHTALLGTAATLPPGRLLISAVEHPATVAAAERLQRQGWDLVRLPVDRRGRLRLESLEPLLEPPTRMVSLIWGQSEVGTLQPIEAVGRLCRDAGVLLHVDAVQVVGHRELNFAALPVDLLSCAAHKIEGPRGIGALLVRPDLAIEPLIGGVQEGGRRGGTEPVVLAAGFAEALHGARRRLSAGGGRDPVARWRDALWSRLRRIPGLRLSGADPAGEDARLPHHLSLLVADEQGSPLSGRDLVRALGREGYALSSGSACRSGAATGASPVLGAMGFTPAEAASGLRISLGPWVASEALEAFPSALERARRRLRSTDGAA